jgi:hypothetical protein
VTDPPITVWYDYTCDDSFRMKLLLDRLGQRARWRTVSLKELRRHDDEPTLFSPDTDSISIFALHVAHAVRHHDFTRFHDDLFNAFHERDAKLEEDDILAIAAESGLDSAEFVNNRPAWLEQLAAEHSEAIEKWGVFGTPTILVDGSSPVYVEISEIPSTRRAAQKIWKAIETVRSTPGIREVKRI